MHNPALIVPSRVVCSEGHSVSPSKRGEIHNGGTISGESNLDTKRYLKRENRKEEGISLFFSRELRSERI